MGYSNKAFLLMGLLFAIVLLISSDVAARDLAQTSNVEKVDATVDDAKYQPDQGHYGGGGGHYGGGGGHYGGGGGGHYGGGGGCRYGCCRHGYHGGCFKCCSYAGQAVDAQTQPKPHN